MSSERNSLAEARASLREQLNRSQPGGVPARILTLTREQAEVILAGPVEPSDILDEVRRLAASVSKDDVERWARKAEDFRICTGGKRIPIGKRCPHCGAKPAGEECRL